MKAECFPLTYDKGFNYIDFSKVMNQENTGYMQRLQKIEAEIFRRTNKFLEAVEITGKLNYKDTRYFYEQLDDYVRTAYKNELGIELEK